MKSTRRTACRATLTTMRATATVYRRPGPPRGIALRPPPDDRGAPPLVEEGPRAEGARFPPPPYERFESPERGADGAGRATCDGASKRRGVATEPGMRVVGAELPIQRDDRAVPGVDSNSPPRLLALERGEAGEAAGASRRAEGSDRETCPS